MVESWKMEVPINMRVPMPPEILVALVRYSILRGLSTVGGQSCLWISFGVALMTGFRALLRPGGLAGPIRSRIKIPEDWPTRLTSADTYVLFLFADNAKK